MQEFYSKKDKKPRVPKFNNNLAPKTTKKKDPTMPTFTVEEMMKTVNTSEGVHVDYNFGNVKKEAPYVGDISGTGGQRSKKKSVSKKKESYNTKKMKAKFGKTFGNSSQSKSKKSGLKVTNPYGEVRKKSKNEKPDKFDRTGSVEKKQATLKNAEFMMMMSDINDYKQKIANNDDINKFEEFLKGDVVEEEDEEGLGESAYSDGQSHLRGMNMKDAIKYMTREERQEYLKQIKQKKKKRFEDELKKQNSFKPKINKKSKAIDGNRTKNMKFKRHDLLFGLNTVLKQREEQLKEVIEAERFMKYAQEELNECTFHPKINRGGNTTINEGSIAQRTKAFMEKKRMKEEEHLRIKEMNEVKDCTFTPKINQGIKGKRF